MSKAVRLEIPITFKTGEHFLPGSIFRWDEISKTYQLKDRKTGEIKALISEQTANNFPEYFNQIEDE